MAQRENKIVLQVSLFALRHISWLVSFCLIGCSYLTGQLMLSE